MAKENDKTADEQVVTQPSETVQMTAEQLNSLTERLNRLEQEKEQQEEKHALEMEALRKSVANDDDDDEDLLDSMHAQYRPLKVYKDNKGVEHPIIWTGGVKSEIEYDEYRRPIVTRQYIEVHVHGDKGIRKLNYSSDMKDPDNYIALGKKYFKLVNQSEHDYNKTGASNVKPDQIISDYGKIELKIRDESSGLPKGTGKYVRGIAKAHKYEYTVLIDDAPVILDKKPK